MTLTSPTGATLFQPVNGFARIGSDVLLITPVGHIALDGGHLSYFDDAGSAIFDACGFAVSTPSLGDAKNKPGGGGTRRRRLLGAAVTGTANAAPAVTALAAAPPPPAPPGMVVSSYQPGMVPLPLAGPSAFGSVLVDAVPLGSTGFQVGTAAVAAAAATPAQLSLTSAGQCQYLERAFEETFQSPARGFHRAGSLPCPRVLRVVAKARPCLEARRAARSGAQHQSVGPDQLHLARSLPSPGSVGAASPTSCTASKPPPRCLAPLRATRSAGRGHPGSLCAPTV